MRQDYLKPCCYCTFAEACSYRSEILNSLDFLKFSISIPNQKKKGRPWVSSMGLTCRKYFTQYQPGQRITFYWVADTDTFFRENDISQGNLSNDEYEDYCMEMGGTITGWKRRRVKIFLDETIEINGKETQVICLYPRYERLTLQYFTITGDTVKLCKCNERPASYDCKDCYFECSRVEPMEDEIKFLDVKEMGDQWP